jgi:hypothetical protein
MRREPQCPVCGITKWILDGRAFVACFEEPVQRLAGMGNVNCVQRRTRAPYGCHDVAFLGKHFPSYARCWWLMYTALNRMCS